MNRTTLAIPLCLALTLGVCALAAALAPAVSGNSPMQDALAMLRSGKCDQAEQKASAIAAGRSAQAQRAYLVVAVARQRQGRYDAAADAYKSFLATCNSPELREYAVRQVQACHEAQVKPLVPVAPSQRLDQASAPSWPRSSRTSGPSPATISWSARTTPSSPSCWWSRPRRPCPASAS